MTEPAIKELLMHCYRLEGASHLAAMKLDSIVQEFHQKHPIDMNGRNLGDVQKDHRSHSDFILAEIEKRDPALFKACGLDFETIQVSGRANLFYRSYARFPDIVAAPTKKPEYYMYVPVDYKGRHFVPEGGVLLNKKETDRAGDLLFAGGWLGNGPILKREESGVALPADFDRKTDRVVKGGYSGPKGAQYRYFKAEGRTLEMIRDHDGRREAISKSFHAIIEYVKSSLPAIIASGAAKTDPQEGYYPGFMMGRDREGLPVLEISIRAEGRKGIMMAGQPVALSSNDYFDVRKDENGRDILVTHTRTPQARTIKALVDTIPSEPSYYNYPALVYPEPIKALDKIDAMIGASPLPVVRKQSDGIFLQYRQNKGKKVDFCPPDCVEIDAAAYLWAEADHANKQRGVTPPPRPAHIKPIADAALSVPSPAKDAVTPAAPDSAPQSLPAGRNGNTQETPSDAAPFARSSVLDAFEKRQKLNFLFRVMARGWTPNASLTPLPRSTALDKASTRKGPIIK